MNVQHASAAALRLTADVYAAVLARDPGQSEFHQAAREVLESLEPVLARHPEYMWRPSLRRSTQLTMINGGRTSLFTGRHQQDHKLRL